jgi:hypothetical protein
MVATWARETDGNLFPLCKRTSFKLTLEESINKSRSVDRVGVQKPLQPSKRHHTRPYRFLERNFLRIQSTFYCSTMMYTIIKSQEY